MNQVIKQQQQQQQHQQQQHHQQHTTTTTTSTKTMYLEFKYKTAIQTERNAETYKTEANYVMPPPP